MDGVLVEISPWPLVHSVFAYNISTVSSPVRQCKDAGMHFSPFMLKAEAEQLCHQNLELLICHCNSPCYFHICSAAFA